MAEEEAPPLPRGQEVVEAAGEVAAAEGGALGHVERAEGMGGGGEGRDGGEGRLDRGAEMGEVGPQQRRAAAFGEVDAIGGERGRGGEGGLDRRMEAEQAAEQGGIAGPVQPALGQGLEGGDVMQPLMHRGGGGAQGETGGLGGDGDTGPSRVGNPD